MTAIYDKALDHDAVKYLLDGSGSKPDDADCLVKLSCDDLTSGKLTAWKNKGRAGGKPAPCPQARPSRSRASVAGSKAVTFDGRGTFIQSSFNAPESLTWRNPFTVETLDIRHPKVNSTGTASTMAPATGVHIN